MIGTLCCLLALLIALYYYLIGTYNFWEKRGVPGPKPRLIFGTMKDVILYKMFLGDYIKRVYDTYDADTPLIGIFKRRTPILIIKDTELIKDVLIRDASLFSDRAFNPCVKAEIMDLFFFMSDGKIAQWMRTKLSSAFTPSKLKDIFHVMVKSLERLDNYMEELLLTSDKVNCSDVTGRFTADVISNSMIGIDTKPLTRGASGENRLLKCMRSLRGTMFSHAMKELFPRLYDLIGRYMSDNIRTRQYFVNFFTDISQHRKAHAIDKSDVFGLLMKLKENPGKLTEELPPVDVTDEFLSAQLFGLFYAGYETSAVVISNTLHELALNQRIQDKLRAEIQQVYANNNGELKFEHVNTMLYLNAVFKETERRYPAASLYARRSVTNYTFRNTNVTIPKDHVVVIPLYAMHHDPVIYPKPFVYDPERFIDENGQSKNLTHFMPFGQGPRNCLGERLGILQVKVALIGLVRKYKFDICEHNTCSYNKVSIVPLPEKDIFLKITKID